ncbi:MAG TPA: response regulator [Chitinophagaceae bacterium]|nr:response regulator [Chitinophagaceae bacterium]
MYHTLLDKQIKKHLNGNAEDNVALQKFLSVVNESYQNFERDKELSEHAFAISENEYADINAKLREEIDLRKRSVTKLIDTIRSIEHSSDFKELSGHDLEEIIDYLKIQIEKRRQAELEMKAAKEVAEKAAMARSEFLSMMSHEIRTPLNAVVGFTYLLLQGRFLPEQEEQLNLLKFSAENLLALINDILDFNKIESGKVSLEKTSFNLPKLINQIRNTNFTKAQDNGNNIRVMFDTQIPTLVKGDPLRIGQVINNLVSNAVKFTHNGIVIIEAMLLKQTHDNIEIQISVKDNGIGIEPENQKKIFEIFTQASDSTTRQYGGSGLGLAICNGLLEIMHSHVSLESTPGKGSVFSFILNVPYADEAEQYSPDSDKLASADPDLAGTRVLLVEDNNVNTLVATTFLKRWNTIVDTADNGKVALEKIRENTYHIILMDLHMPEMNGYEACKQIMQIKPKLPVIALTASAMLNIRDKAFEVGMIDYVTKPFEPNELYEKIRKNRLPLSHPL